jgi:hypothetical protein
MPNQHILQRLTGIQQILMGVHQGSTPMSNATSGHERAAFIDQFLSQAFSSPFRFGTGDATDAAGSRSGQLDVVVEFPFVPSLPLTGGGARLYLAESVAAVVEVKSNVAAQWNQALHTAAQLAPLRRNFGAQMIMGRPPTANIPLFVAAYTGWNQVATVSQKLAAAPDVDGILVIDTGIFVSSARFGGVQATGPWALWGLVCCLHDATSSLKAASPQPLAYAV